MAIDIKYEVLLSLSDAAKTLPCIDGKRVHVSTLWRWCKRGLKGVRLEYVRVGFRICTSSDALSRFINELAAADQQLAPSHSSAEPAKQSRSPAVRRTAIERANEILADNKI